MKTWVFLFLGCRVFLDGAEEFFILPTAWYYIDSFGETKAFLGFVLSAYSISAVFVGPIVGRLADRFGKIKCIATTCFALHVVGNLVYSMPISAYFPLMGRFISGMGNAVAGVFYGQIALYTNEKYCAQVFIFLDGMFTLGAIFGPFISSVLLFNVDILGWEINGGNSPGIVLAIIWFIMLLVGLFLPKEIGKEKTSRGETTSVYDDKHDLLSKQNKADPLQRCWNSTILCLFYLTFFCFFYTTMVTFYTPLLASEHFHLQFTHVKVLFLNSSLFSLVLFLLLYIVAEYFDERKLIASLMFFQILAIAMLTYFAFCWENASYSEINGYFLLVYICVGMPYFQFALSCSLMSKITHPDNAAFYQGSSYATLHLSYVSGRLIAGFIFTRTPLLCLSLGLTLSWFVGVLWFSLEFYNFELLQFKR